MENKVTKTTIKKNRSWQHCLSQLMNKDTSVNVLGTLYFILLSIGDSDCPFRFVPNILIFKKLR